MGSGKTTIGKVVAKKMNMNFIDMDTHIENQQFKTIPQIFEILGEEKFRKLEQKCLQEVSQYENVIIATGGGAPCHFDNMEMMNRYGETIYICFTAEQLSERLKHTQIHKRPILAKYPGDNLLPFIMQNLELREPYYNQAKFKVSGSDVEIASQIVKLIQKKI